MQSVDVAIVGGGLAGLAVACGLQGSGLRVAVMEQRVPEPLAGGRTTTTARFGYQCRQRKNYSPVLASGRTFSRRASCYHGMEVWDKDSFGHISFDDQKHGL
ncbi:FAD-dependent oxidoreductase [Escherichia coli]